LGAQVTAVCSHRNVELVAELGADRVIDYTKTELVDLKERFDVIFDVFGNYHFDKLEHLLTPRGTYVHTVPSARIFKDVARTLIRRKRAKLVIVKSRREQLDWIRQQIDAGSLRVVVDRSFALDDAAEAHRYMETKRARGKVVLEVG
jgi:NADPH:quinone reductase-like Zn-dependent oxidoreductase